ncbi:MAG TPA: competence/damage-inducible protein A [Solirubrobacteraceae bacterium]|nr:competence/damage-inducible protein A [Solirubrobacteraceae bacterium]
MSDAGFPRGRPERERRDRRARAQAGASAARAGIVVTGTEVLSGRVSDRNGPWLAERLSELGVDLAHVAIVGDRREDLEAALRFMRDEGLDLVLTSGGLGPTADDLTTEVVARFQGRELTLDEELEGVIAEVVRPLAERRPDLDREAMAAGTRKQATIPRGATVLAPVGTAPGLVVAPAGPEGGPTVVVLPGPPRELQPMWPAAVATDALRAAIANATRYERGTLRLFGIPESEVAQTLREAEGRGVELSRLEVTTCLKRGEIEIVTRYEPAQEPVYVAFENVVKARHPDTLFSTDGSTVDEQVAGLLRERGWTIAVAESCTGGELAARLTAPAGSSEYVRGGVVAYANEAKVKCVGVEPRLIEAHGAVSEQVAKALAGGVSERLEADVGVGVTGVAGPGGGSERKPVGLVWLSVAGPGGRSVTRSVSLPGGRADVRDRATTVAMHLVRRLLLGESDPR